MKRKTSNLSKRLLIASVSVCSFSGMAQVPSGASHTPEKTTTYLLPDGKVFAIEKLDTKKV